MDERLALVGLLFFIIGMILTVVALGKWLLLRNGEIDSGSNPVINPIPEASVEIPPKERTLDEEYADKHGLVVCKYCESLNDFHESRCCACGKMLMKWEGS